MFTPSGKRGRFPIGTPVLEAARSLGVDIDSVCGGRAICGRCQILCSEGDFAKHGIQSSASHLSGFTRTEERWERVKKISLDGRRLSCQARLEGDVVIDVPPDSQVHRQVVRKGADLLDIELNPLVRLYYVDVQEPDMHTPSGDMQRLLTALEYEWHLSELSIEPSILPMLQPALRQEDWKVTVAVADNQRVIAVWPGFKEQTLGVAVDVGSTTIAAHLCDLMTGDVLASNGIMNPQIRFGEDLMSRVSYVMMNPGGDTEMTTVVRGAMDFLATDLATDAGIDPAQIVEAVVVCNPVMHHLLLGIDPVELGQAPFALATSDPVNTAASALGLSSINPAARGYLLPCIAGHVGADCAAVALSEEPYRSDDLVLICDVGTNAEILLGTKDRVLACSSPTGPAFEGAQISSGQRAAPGAIERIEINPDTKEPRFRVIGSDLWSDDPGFSAAIATTGVTGICGSGIIEAVAEMRIAGLLDPSGLIGSAAQTGTERAIPDGRTHAYLVWDGEDGTKITVTQGDIRAIQLAKSALYAGARLLMDEFDTDTVDRIVLAGAFGAHISPKHAMVLGMIPDCELDKVTSAGNAAGTGARIALCDITARARIETEVHRIHKVETAIEPRFQEHFIAANAIPHATAAFPELGKVVVLPEVGFNAGGGEDGRKRRRRRG